MFKLSLAFLIISGLFIKGEVESLMRLFILLRFGLFLVSSKQVAWLSHGEGRVICSVQNLTLPLLLAVMTTIHILPIDGLFLSWISIFQVSLYAAIIFTENLNFCYQVSLSKR